MAFASPAKPLLLSLLVLLLISAAQCYDRHAVSSSVARRSRRANRHPHRHATLPRRCVLAENTSGHHRHRANSSSNHNTTTNPTSNATTPAASPEDHSHHTHKHRVRNWIIGFVVGTLAGVISGLLLSVLFRLVLNFIRGRYRTNSGISIFSPKLIKNAEHLAFLEKEEGLSALTVIGRGGCGEVYKAQLPIENEGEEPKFIAIKKIKKQLGDGPTTANLSDEESRQLDKWMRQIQSEIRTVGHIRHRNLLPLAAHVPRPDCHYLVYDFMKNGSLQDTLRGVREGRGELPWLARLRVAIGIASGLEYLHVSQRPQIIHRDLKPANILLDDDMEARIADFGLAKTMPDANTHVTTSNVAGTVGYIAPEYHQTLKFTAKCDIYSFGVILAVLVTGKEPSDQFFQEVDEIGLVKWLRRVMASGEHDAAIDKSIAGSGFDEQMLLVLRIACFCTADDPKERPSAKDVRCMLSQIKT